MPTIRDDYDALGSEERRPILERDDYTCQDCGKQGEWNKNQLDVHHIVPYRMGGTHDPANLVTLCKPCHQKRDREYRAQLGRERMAANPRPVQKAFAVEFSEETQQQVRELKKQFGAQLFTLAIDRLYWDVIKKGRR